MLCLSSHLPLLALSITYPYLYIFLLTLSGKLYELLLIMIHVIDPNNIHFFIFYKVDNQNRTDSNPAVIWFPHVTVTPCSADVVCRLRVCLHLVLELFVSIVEIQTHVQQLVVQKHISYNSIFNCSHGSPLWDPRNVSVSMNLTVSITCKVSCVRVIHGSLLTLLLET